MSLLSEDLVDAARHVQTRTANREIPTDGAAWAGKGFFRV